jgi:hypothetical protein
MSEVCIERCTACGRFASDEEAAANSSREVKCVDCTCGQTHYQIAGKSLEKLVAAAAERLPQMNVQQRVESMAYIGLMSKALTDYHHAGAQGDLKRARKAARQAVETVMKYPSCGSRTFPLFWMLLAAPEGVSAATLTKDRPDLGLPAEFIRLFAEAVTASDRQKFDSRVRQVGRSMFEDSQLGDVEVAAIKGKVYGR